MEICSIILSAGKGSRMHSNTAKPLHTISGKPMIEWVIDATEMAGIHNNIIVIPENNNDFKEISKKNKTVIQKFPLGTGDAVKKAISSLKNFNGLILICFADTPFIKTESLTKIINTFDDKTKLVITGFRKIEKNNYGKIFFSSNFEPIEIVEQKDCEEKNIHSEFCNGGIMCIHSSVINDLDKIIKNKITGEFYLTDLVNILFKSEKKISFVEIEEEEILGINNQIDLSIAEKIAQNSLRKKAMLNGVKMIDPNSVFLNFDTKLQKNVVIHPNVVFGKNVTIEEYVEINEDQYKLFFDFENIKAEYKHMPYLCWFYNEGLQQEFIGINKCAVDMLNALPTDKKEILLIAHNSDYDCRFLLEYLQNVQPIVKSDRFLHIKATYYNPKVKHNINIIIKYLL